MAAVAVAAAVVVVPVAGHLATIHHHHRTSSTVAAAAAVVAVVAAAPRKDHLQEVFVAAQEPIQTGLLQKAGFVPLTTQTTLLLLQHLQRQAGSACFV